MRADAGLLTDQRNIRVAQPAAAGGDASRRVAQEARAVGVLPRGLAGREMTADIAFRQRPVDRVAERMDADIGARITGAASATDPSKTEPGRPVAGDVALPMICAN